MNRTVSRFLLGFTGLGLVLALAGCSPDNPAGSPVNPNSSFSVTAVTYIAIPGPVPDPSQAIRGAWISGTSSAPNLVLTHNTQYIFGIVSGTLASPVEYDNPDVGPYGPSSDYCDLMNRDPQNFLVTIASLSPGLLTSMKYGDMDASQVMNPLAFLEGKSAPVGRWMSIQTGAASSGTLALSLIRRPNKGGWGAVIGGTCVSASSNLNGAINDQTFSIPIQVQ